MDNPKILFVSQPVGFPVPSVNTSYEVEKVVLDDFRLDGGILIEAILLCGSFAALHCTVTYNVLS